MKFCLQILLMLSAIWAQGQAVTNGDFSAAGSGWGCNPENHFETVYGGVDPTNRVAEIDAQAGLCQTITGFVVGNDYTFSMDVSRRTTCGPTLQSFNFEIDSGQVLSAAVSRNGVPWGWTEECFTFTATDTVHEILFYGTSPSTCALLVDNLEINKKPPNNLTKDTTLCFGDSLILLAADTNGTYLWQNNSSSFAYIVDTTGIFWVQTTVKSCVFYDTIKVSYNQPISLDLGSDSSLCSGDSILLSALHHGARYNWSTGSISSEIMVHFPGTYWVEVTSGNCTYSDTIIITFNNPPILDLGNDTTICQNDSLVLDAGCTNCSYKWHNGSTSSHFLLTNSGTYWVEVKNQTGCASHDTIKITSEVSSDLNLGNDTIICSDDGFLLDASSVQGTYLWQDQSTSSTLFTYRSGMYWVEVSSACGSVFDTIQVKHKSCECPVFTANSFSPNTDGLNDFYKPILNCVPSDYEFTVVNRWGEIIYFTNNPKDKWDGTHKGQPCPIGIYTYQLKYRFDMESQTIESGKINLLR